MEITKEVEALRDEVAEELHGLPYGAIMPGDTAIIDAVVAVRVSQLLTRTSAA